MACVLDILIQELSKNELVVGQVGHLREVDHAAEQFRDDHSLFMICRWHSDNARTWLLKGTHAMGDYLIVVVQDLGTSRTVVGWSVP